MHGISRLTYRRPRIAVVWPDRRSTLHSAPREKILAIAREASSIGKVDLIAYDASVSLIEVEAEVTPVNLASRGWISPTFRLLWRLLTSRYDLVVTQTFFSVGLLFVLFAAKLGRSRILFRESDPLEKTIREMKAELKKRIPFLFLAGCVVALSRYAEQFVLSLSDRIIVPCPTHQKMISEGMKSRLQAHVVYNCMSLPPIPDTSLDPSFQHVLDSVCTVVVYFGHMQRDIRGIEAILQSLTLVTASVRVVFLGENQDPDFFGQMINNYEINDRVLLLNAKPKPEALAYLRRAHYGILGPQSPYYVPTKVFDCLQLGIPLILSDRAQDILAFCSSVSLTYRYGSISSLAATLDRCHLKRDALIRKAQELVPQWEKFNFNAAMRREMQDLLQGRVIHEANSRRYPCG
jgi:hypothetical protein